MTDQIRRKCSSTPYLYWNETPFKLYEGENWLVIHNGNSDDDENHDDGIHQTLQILPLQEMLKNGKRHCLCPATKDTFLCFEVCNENEIVTTTVKNMLLPSRIDQEHAKDDDDDDDHGYLAYIVSANDKNSRGMIYLERRAASKQLQDGDRIIIRNCEDPTDASLNVEYRMREELDETRSTPNEHNQGMETNRSSNVADCCSSRMDEDVSNNDNVDERNDSHAAASAEYSQLTEGTSSSSYSYIDEVIETQQQQLQQHQQPFQTQSGTMELLTQPDEEQTETFNGKLNTLENSFATKPNDTAAMMPDGSTDGDGKQSTSTKEQYSHKQGQDSQNEQPENIERESDDDSTVDPCEQKLQTQTSSAKTSSSETGRNKPKILSERVVEHCVSAKSNMDVENVPLVVTTTTPKTPKQNESTSAMKSAASNDLISPDLLNDSIDDHDVDEEEEDIQNATRTKCDIKRKLDVSDDGETINYSQNILDDVSNTGNSGTLESTKTSEIEHSKDDKKDDVQVSSIQIQENNHAQKLDEINENTNASISTDVCAGASAAAIRAEKSAENEDLEMETAGSKSAPDTSKQGCVAESSDLTVGPMASDAGYQNDHEAGKSPSKQPTEDEQNFASKPSKSASYMEDLADRSMVKFDGGKTVANPKPVHSVDNSKNTLQAEALPVERIDENNSGSSTVVGQKMISRKRKANTTNMDTTPKKRKATLQSSRNNNRMKDIQSADERFDEDSTCKKSLRSATKPNRKDGQTLNEQAQGELRILVTGFDLDSKQEKMVKAIGGTLIQDIKYAHTATHVIACDGKSKTRRTPKLMIAMSVTPNIVTLEWLSRSAPKKAPLPCDKYLLRDKEFEKTYDFSMEKACNKINSRVSKGERLLDGWSVYVCPGVSGNKAPPTTELKLIVEAAGGSWLTKLESNPTLSYDKTLIITSDPPTGKQEKAKSVERAVHKGAKKRTTSWLFRTTITQELDI